MKAPFKTTTILEIEYISLSEQLREELELKIEDLYKRTHFAEYKAIHLLKYQKSTKPDFLSAYLISRSCGDYVLSGKLVQGIKIWFNMYYDDRLSVIDKFRGYYQKVNMPDAPDGIPGMNIVFCKFLINDLLSTLADTRWQTLVNHAD
jgi:hypothetical protein